MRVCTAACACGTWVRTCTCRHVTPHIHASVNHLYNTQVYRGVNKAARGGRPHYPRTPISAAPISADPNIRGPNIRGPNIRGPNIRRPQYPRPQYPQAPISAAISTAPISAGPNIRGPNIRRPHPLQPAHIPSASSHPSASPHPFSQLPALQPQSSRGLIKKRGPTTPISEHARAVMLRHTYTPVSTPLVDPPSSADDGEQCAL